MTTRAEFDLAAKLAREYADDCEAIGDPVRAQWAREKAAKFVRRRDGDWWTLVFGY